MRASGSAELQGSHARASRLRAGLIVHCNINSASQHRELRIGVAALLGRFLPTWAALRGGLFFRARDVPGPWAIVTALGGGRRPTWLRPL